jgi:hypothetical protein
MLKYSKNANRTLFIRVNHNYEWVHFFLYASIVCTLCSLIGSESIKAMRCCAVLCSRFKHNLNDAGCKYPGTVGSMSTQSEINTEMWLENCDAGCHSANEIFLNSALRLWCGNF